MRTTKLYLLVYFVLSSMASATLAKEPDLLTLGGLDSATIVAFERIGAMYGSWFDEPENKTFREAEGIRIKGLPGFRFWWKLPDSGLPNVDAPFGLRLGTIGQSGDLLKTIGHLKRLELLDLSHVKGVTPARLRELAPLQQLKALSLRGTGTTDDELQALESLTSLTYLDLAFTKVTNLRGLAAPKSAATGLRPADFQLKTIAEDAGTLRMWNDALKAASESTRDNAYKRLLQALDRGETPTKKMLDDAFKVVNVPDQILIAVFAKLTLYGFCRG